jgi:uncharacterized RDD family membrane protein YckC
MNPEDVNPYAAPKSNVETCASAAFVEAPNAGLGKRFLNSFLDFIAVLGVVFVLFFVLAVIEEMGYRINSEELFANASEFQQTVIVYLLFFGYYTCCEGFFGRSFGKLITGTKVVTLSGAPLTIRSAMLRSFIRLLPFEALSFFGSFGYGVGSGWHDKWTSTRVVDLRAIPVISHGA